MRKTRSRCPQTTCVMIALPLGTPDVLSPTNPDMESHSCLARRGTLVCMHQALADFPGPRLDGLHSICAGTLISFRCRYLPNIVSQGWRARQGSNYANAQFG